MRAIFFKELKDQRVTFLVLLGAFVALALSPSELGRTWSGLSVFLMIPMLGCYTGTRLMGAETEDDQLEMLLTLPIPRWRIWAAKASAGLLFTVVTMAISLAVGWTQEPLFRRGGELLIYGSSVLLMYALGAFYSFAFQRTQAASFASLGTYFMGLTLMASSVRHVGGAGYRTNTETLGVYTLVCVVITLAASAWVFTRADLLDLRERRRAALRAALWSVLAALAALLFYYLPSTAI